MRHSDSIVNISAALFAVQKELEPVKKDSTNPHFKNRYASLETINEYVIELLNKHGILIMQGGGESQPNGTISVETMLVHIKTGEFVTSEVIMPLQKQDPQGAGSAITYGRRYNICALLCISTEDDDDAEGAIARAPRQVQSVASQTGHQLPPLQQRSRPAAQSPVPSCPKCGSDMWDNRGRKTNPRAPDFRCKDKANCDGAIWPEKQSQQATTQTQQRVARHVQEPPPPQEREPWEEDQDPDLPF
jgi:hypothetical protein